MFDEIGCTDIGCIKVDNCYFLLIYCTFYYHEVSLFISFDQFNFEVYFDMGIATPAIFLDAIFLVNLLLAFHLKPLFKRLISFKQQIV
jgi:hypothetical protein